MSDSITFEILEDGTISIKTSSVSRANHLSADQLLAQLAKLAGGTIRRQKRLDIPVNVATHVHTHADGTAHSH